MGGRVGCWGVTLGREPWRVRWTLAGRSPHPPWSPTPPTGRRLALGRSTPRPTPSAAIPPATPSTSSAMLPRFDGKVLERPGRPLPAHRGRRRRGARGDCRAEAPGAPVAPLRWSKGFAGRRRRSRPRPGSDRRASSTTATDCSDPARRSKPIRPLDVRAWPRTSPTARIPARAVVIQLLVDDGVADRGHREQHPGPEARASPGSPADRTGPTGRCA